MSKPEDSGPSIDWDALAKRAQERASHRSPIDDAAAANRVIGRAYFLVSTWMAERHLFEGPTWPDEGEPVPPHILESLSKALAEESTRPIVEAFVNEMVEALPEDDDD